MPSEDAMSALVYFEALLGLPRSAQHNNNTHTIINKTIATAAYVLIKAQNRTHFSRIA